MATQPSTGFALTLERTIAAPPEKVFDAFTQAETLARWFGPSDQYTCTVPECDARVGGRYRIEMRHSGGNVHVVQGVYEQVSRPNRLVFSFAWENMPERGHSRVTVGFEKAGTGTKLVLFQEQLPSAEMREAHTAGWTGCLTKLVQMFA
jgi:uncharacterized protein YndB with AHSA1/START domain